MSEHTEAPKLSGRFSKALVYAELKHHNQVRKGGDIPYVGHLLSVASLVINDGGSEDQAIAALLHDAVEDQGGPPTLEEIRANFGEDVARIVEQCSDATPEQGQEKPPWRERKQRYIDHLGEVGHDTLLVSVADKLDNARSMLRDYHEHGSALWDRFNRKNPEDHLWYYESLLKGYRKHGLDSWMVAELRRVVAELRTLVEQKRSQRITANDIAIGQIRFPGSAKALFPSEPATVDVDVVGTRRQARWNPRDNADRPRSGVLGFGVRSLDGLVQEDETLGIKQHDDGLIELTRP